MKNFSDIKKLYVEARENQRRRIIDYLAEQKDSKGDWLFKNDKGIPYAECSNKYSGGMGRSTYGKTRFQQAYNLNNWKYIETQCDNTLVHISLQSFDIDPNSGNIHTLMDRIGLYFYSGTPEKIKMNLNGKKLSVTDYFLKMQTTELELPLSDENLAMLVSLIKDGVQKNKENE